MISLSPSHIKNIEENVEINMENIELKQRLLEKERQIAILEHDLKVAKLDIKNIAPDYVLDLLEKAVHKMNFEDHARTLYECLSTITIHAANNPNYDDLESLHNFAENYGDLESDLAYAANDIDERNFDMHPNLECY